MLDPVNDTVVKAHRNQVGCDRHQPGWDVQRPYTFTTSPTEISDDGVGGFESFVLRIAPPTRH